MGNSKKFIVCFDCALGIKNDYIKMIKEDLCSIDRVKDPKFITFLHYLADTIILVTANDTYWDSNKLNDYIHKKCQEKNWNPSQIVIEITGTHINGYMNDKFWKTLKLFSDVNQYANDLDRSKKLKKIKFLMDQNNEIKKREEEIKKKEQELLKKEQELLKEQERKRILDELTKKEKELKQKEVELDKKLNDSKSWWDKILKH